MKHFSHKLSDLNSIHSHLTRNFFFILLFNCIFQFAGAQVTWPSITKETRPWTRWWWEGSAVNKKDLTWNLEQYRSAGLGGVEITPIYGIHGYEDRFINFLSPAWMDVLKHTLDESKRLGLGVDLANATGWPFGGPWVNDGDASKSVYFKTYTLKGGESLQQPVEYIQEAFVRTANNKPAGIDSIRRPISENKNLQLLALDQVVFPGKLPVQALVAYSENGQIIDLGSKLGVDGRLNWTAPAGNWTIYALFEGLHGKMVERAAPGGEGYAIDHFSSTAANNYFKKFDQAFRGYDLSYLRAFFNDSYEVDDARGQANWTPQLFPEFRKRRGYDLKDHLPALFGKDQEDQNSRVRYDYRATIDELILEHFTEIWARWGRSKGKKVRNQSHGSPANTLDLYSAVDIPETEGTDVLRFKFASSAANVSGKKLVSSESATWLNEHFLSSWSDVKKAIDLYFLGGVNHIFYHGTAYSAQDVPWPGWLFYAAVHFQPTNPQWKDFKTLNDYVTRVQSFLQQGRPDNDVLLYYPIIDRYSEPGRDLLQHFDGMERNFEKTDFEHVSRLMLDNGYSFDFISDRQLQKVSNSGNRLVSGGNEYRTVLLPANKLIDETTFRKLLALAKSGASILVYKNLPKDVPGLGGLGKRRNEFLQLAGQLKFNEVNGLKTAVLGKGAFFMSDDLELLLTASRARKEAMAVNKLNFIRRKNTDGYTYFITNRSDAAISQEITLGQASVSVALFDPLTGQSGLARHGHEKNASRVYIRLQPFESIIVRTYNSKKAGASYPYTKENGEAYELKGEWNIEFTEGGPVLPAAVKTRQLGSWTELGGEDVKNFSGTARYTVSFSKPAAGVAAYRLNLGRVHETATVLLNGRKITTLIGPSYSVILPASFFQETNQLDVIVSSLMANRIAYMDRNQIPWKIFYNTNMPARKRENIKNGLFDASGWTPQPSGLLGPVTLTPVAYEK